MLMVHLRKRRNANGDSSVVDGGGIPRSFRLMLVLSITLILAVGLLIAKVRSERAEQGGDEPLPVLKQVPAFSLTERSGRIVTPDDFLGSVWVANFFFTSCNGPCPELSLRMRSLQEGLGRFSGGARLVSFSVDPTFDTPAVLSAYATRYSADPKLWWFLTTTDEATMHTLVKEGFLQTVLPRTVASQIIHTTQILLIDKRGRIRASYDGLDPESKGRVLRDIKRLLSEPAA